MAKKVKVQDGSVVYSAPPSPSTGLPQPLEFTVLGNFNINSSPNGAITAIDQDLVLTAILDGNAQPGNTNNVVLQTSGTGQILLDNQSWLSTTSVVNPGGYLGAKASNALEFYPFYLSPAASSDTLTISQLNTEYPTAQIGQAVVGPTTIYHYVGSGSWRQVGNGGAGYLPLSGGTLTGPLIGTTITATSSFVGSLSGNALTASAINGTGTNAIIYQTGTNTTTFIASPTTSGTFLSWDGSTFSWKAPETPFTVNSQSGSVYTLSITD